MPNYISNVRMPSSLIYSSSWSQVDLRPALPAKRNPCRSAKPSTDCQLCPASDFLHNVQSDWIHVSFSKSKKTPGQHLKETSFKFSRTSNSWDLSTRICIYICIYMYIYMYFSLLHVTVWKPGNWFESVAHPYDGEAGFLHSRPSQVPLFFPIIKGSRRGMAWPTTLANV